MSNRGIRNEPQDEYEGKVSYQAKGYVTKDLGFFEYKRFSCKKRLVR